MRTIARLRLLRNDRNLGFGPACNRGAAIARGDALLFLNPDCMIEPRYDRVVARDRGADPTLGLLGIEIVIAGRPRPHAAIAAAIRRCGAR